MTLPRCRCVVFDIDDTLYLERDYVRSGIGAVSNWLEERHPGVGFFAAAWDAFERGVRGAIFDEALTTCGIETSSSIVDALVAVYRSHEPDISALPDAAACIESLRDGATLAVVTDGPAASQRAKIGALGVQAWADSIVVCPELGPNCGKPSVRAFEATEAATGWRGADCVYIADNPLRDFAGPRSLGWHTIRVRRAGGLHVGIPSGDDVDHEVVDLSALVGR